MQAQSNTQRLVTLVERWLRHCEEFNHTPLADGGTATYDMNIGVPRRIVCREKRCRWESSLDEAD